MIDENLIKHNKSESNSVIKSFIVNLNQIVRYADMYNHIVNIWLPELKSKYCDYINYVCS